MAFFRTANSMFTLAEWLSFSRRDRSLPVGGSLSNYFVVRALADRGSGESNA